MHTRFHKTRLAPTPSGYLHLGNVLSFALTAALAQKYGATTLLRIDDLDQARANEAYIKDIFDTLLFLDIPWQEGPKDLAAFTATYSQVHRLELYHAALSELRQSGRLFACNCTRSQLGGAPYPGTCLHRGLPLDAPGVQWRLDTSGAPSLILNTLSGAHSEDLPEDMQYFVVRKKDGFPAYHLASVVDDSLFGIDLVVRGSDLYNSTIGQLYLSSLLQGNSFHQAIFYHHALLRGAEGAKLSKSSGATSIQYLRGQHFSSKDIYQCIGRMMGLPGSVFSWRGLAEAAMQDGE